MRDAKNIHEVVKLGVDWLGFVFWQQSPRYVRQISSRAGIIPDYSSLDEQENLLKPVPSNVKSPRLCGVFVDDMPQNIVTRVVNYNLDIVQLHGEESPVMIDNLRRTLDPDIHPGIKIMKALSIGCREDVAKYREYVGHVDYFLFDTKTPLKGGSGSQFDWSVLEAYDGDVPFLLSGGIGPADVERIKAFSHPYFLGIDLNSGFETEPAMKDTAMLEDFLNKLK